jgi:hypothetical protein
MTKPLVAIAGRRGEMTEQLFDASTAQPFYLIVTDHDRSVLRSKAR